MEYLLIPKKVMKEFKENWKKNKLVLDVLEQLEKHAVKEKTEKEKEDFIKKN